MALDAAYTLKTLPNGIRLMTVPYEGTDTVTVLVSFRVGSRYETRRTSGTAHLIEHMMFKGTRRRPDRAMISRELDGSGAEHNGYTSKDLVEFYIKLPHDGLAFAVDMLDDLVFHSLFRDADMEAERKVIMEEIRMYEDNPMTAVSEVLDEMMFGDSPMGWNIAGTVASVGNVPRKDVLAFRDRYFVPSRTVVTVAGRVDPEEAERIVKGAFGRRRPSRSGREFKPFRAGDAPKGERFRIVKKGSEQVQFSIGFPSLRYGHRLLPALHIMSIILGGGSSSRLYQELREKKGLCYYVWSHVSPYQDMGQFTIQSGLSRDAVDDGIRTIVRELERIVRKGVTRDEVSRAKEYLRGRLLISLEDSAHIAEWYAKQETLLGRVQTPAERLAHIDKVTPALVKEAAGAVIRPGRAAAAMIGAFDEYPKSATIARPYL